MAAQATDVIVASSVAAAQRIHTGNRFQLQISYT